MKTERENLEGLLTERSVDQLRGLAREFRLKGFSRLDKGGLVTLLLDRVDPGTLRDRLLQADHRETRDLENPVPPTAPAPQIITGAPAAADPAGPAAPAAAATAAPAAPVSPDELPDAAAKPAEVATKKAIKEKRFSSFGIWASILGFGVGVIALAVTFILSSSSEKQIDQVNQRLENYDPLKRDELFKAKEKLLTEKDSLLIEKEKKIKELEKALETLCAGTPQDRQAAREELQQGNTAKARVLLTKAITSQCGNLAEDYYQLGNAYFVDKIPQYREALKAYLEADRLAPGNAKYLNMVGVAYYELGEYRQALDYLERALALDMKAPGGARNPETAVRLNNIGLAWYSLGQYEKAIWFYEKALAIDRQAFGEQHPNVARDLNNLGSAWYSLGQNERAIGYYEKALAIDRQAFGEHHPNVANLLNNLGNAYYARGDFRKSVEYHKKALSIMEKCLGSQHPNTIKCKKNLEMAEKAEKR